MKFLPDLTKFANFPVCISIQSAPIFFEIFTSLIEGFINTHKTFIEDLSSKARYKNYIDSLDLIIDYHNNYGNNKNSGNWQDWLSIIPSNITVLSTGFLAAIETKSNKLRVNSYRTLVLELSHGITDELQEILPQKND